MSKLDKMRKYLEQAIEINMQSLEELPENCRKYVEFIEEQIGYPITMVSNGPGREDIIYRKSALSK